MESWMGRMDTLEMKRIDQVTMPLYPPPCQDHEFPISRKLKDLERGGGCFGTNMSGSDVVLEVGTWDRAGCPAPASGAFLTCSSLHNQAVLAFPLHLALPTYYYTPSHTSYLYTYSSPNLEPVW